MTKHASLSPWFSSPPGATGAGLPLLCFPYAGGGTWIFREWVRRLAPDITVYPARLPGRGDRFREAPARNLRELARTMARAVVPALTSPFAVFGHSMGALLAFEFVRELAAAQGPQPVHLIVSAARAPARRHRENMLHTLPDPEFIRAVQSNYGHPHLDSVDPEVLDLLLPTLRADVQVLETYTYVAGEPLTCPISVLAGRDDPLPRDDLQAWNAHSRQPVRLIEFEGGHFYLHEREAELIDQLRRLLLDPQPPTDGAATPAD